MFVFCFCFCHVPQRALRQGAGTTDTRERAFTSQYDIEIGVSLRQTMNKWRLVSRSQELPPVVMSATMTDLSSACSISSQAGCRSIDARKCYLGRGFAVGFSRTCYVTLKRPESCRVNPGSRPHGDKEVSASSSLHQGPFLRAHNNLATSPLVRLKYADRT